jgi:hypothetical protein
VVIVPLVARARRSNTTPCVRSRGTGQLVVPPALRDTVLGDGLRRIVRERAIARHFESVRDRSDVTGGRSIVDHERRRQFDVLTAARRSRRRRGQRCRRRGGRRALRDGDSRNPRSSVLLVRSAPVLTATVNAAVPLPVTAAGRERDERCAAGRRSTAARFTRAHGDRRRSLCRLPVPNVVRRLYHC